MGIYSDPLLGSRDPRARKLQELGEEFQYYRSLYFARAEHAYLPRNGPTTAIFLQAMCVIDLIPNRQFIPSRLLNDIARASSMDEDRLYKKVHPAILFSLTTGINHFVRTETGSTLIARKVENLWAKYVTRFFSRQSFIGLGIIPLFVRLEPVSNISPKLVF